MSNINLNHKTKTKQTKQTKQKKRTNKSKKNNRKKTAKKRIFSSPDFISGDGFMTSVWGPALWHVLHTISFNYPVNPSAKQQHQYKAFIMSLENVLPCGRCRVNLKSNLAHLPLTNNDMKSRDTFSRYIYNLHELVNKMLDKKSNLSYEDVRERYEHFRSRCNGDDSKKNNGENNGGNNDKLTTIPALISPKITKPKENGCINPLHGIKTKCILKIVPDEKQEDTFQMNI